jgi:hypothetical protein
MEQERLDPFTRVKRGGEHLSFTSSRNPLERKELKFN